MYFTINNIIIKINNTKFYIIIINLFNKYNNKKLLFFNITIKLLVIKILFNFILINIKFN